LRQRFKSANDFAIGEDRGSARQHREAMTDDISTETRVAAFIERFDSLVREVGGCAKAARRAGL